MPDEDSELYDAVQLALSEASTIVGRKYRYGAILLAGEDHIPLKSGSNKKPFMRDNIHAEMCVLKGCARPAGKDMMIARLAPSRDSRGTGGGKGGKKGGGGGFVGDDDDDSIDDDDDEPRRAPAVPTAPVGAPPSRSGAGDGGGGAASRKVLNARPCANCEARMVAKGVRRCYFTLNKTTLGVLEYNAEVSS